MKSQVLFRDPAIIGQMYPIYDDVYYMPGFIGQTLADRYLRELQREIPWQKHSIQLFGREVAEPRLTSWHGEPEASYRYSSRTRQPEPMIPVLNALRDHLGDELKVRFNGVLLNRYRNGSDSMGWHSDDEPELGSQPVIASISLGASRRFLLRRRGDKHKVAEILLDHGSLLVMAGASQEKLQHALPRTARPVGERVNLTFRQVSAERNQQNF